MLGQAESEREREREKGQGYTPDVCGFHREGICFIAVHSLCTAGVCVWVCRWGSRSLPALDWPHAKGAMVATTQKTVSHVWCGAPRPRPSSQNTASQVPSLGHAGSSVPRQDVPHVSLRHFSNYTYLTIQIFPLHPIHLILPPQLHTKFHYNSSLVLTRIHTVKIQLGNIVALLATHTHNSPPVSDTGHLHPNSLAR